MSVCMDNPCDNLAASVVLKHSPVELALILSCFVRSYTTGMCMFYVGHKIPWDIEGPQQAVVEALAKGYITGEVLKQSRTQTTNACR